MFICLKNYVTLVANILFIAKKQTTDTESFELLNTACKDVAIGKTQVFEWFFRFKRDEMSMNNKCRFSRPSTDRHRANEEVVSCRAA